MKVTTVINGTTYYGRVICARDSNGRDRTRLIVADWYLTPERRGLVFQQGIPASACATEAA